ncbi:DUF1553 domain-containing protein [Stieleria sp. JC731]|uniref:DUF1553 domain-containing protein n=1 Tax=Pirellulaceae TaxID=2691357 RepID=UPI001E306A92|nr:DUF1553 domain-containing protein [Stieleria sp. JC731]MCC9599076.1 DUF1553 domain-containing protein [Stieleria sp. JC731]
MFRCTFLIACGASLFLAISATAHGDSELSFNRDVRPILSDFCYACHGPDANHREADLRLDDREAAIDYGAIVPGETDASLLIERIMTDDADMVMPPPKGGKKLSEKEKQILKRWIAEGATYEQHWAFAAVPASVPIPEIDKTPSGESWAINAIDHFVAKAHSEQSLSPNQPADRATWLRRVTFDLTGLPPTTDELDLFFNDDKDDAYERVVDRLLKSDAYGERMANMWLDVARYADTFGYQNDMPMEIWPWRDWVIDAFNQNMPYDQFLTEQIAGDLLPNATDDQKLATAFNRLHRQTNEGGSVPEEFRLTGIADRTTTAGTAFLALTFECSRCHDHKFDPIKQRDFYRLSAYFSDIDEFGLYSHFTRAQPSPAMLLFDSDDQRRSYQEAVHAVHVAQKSYDQAFESAKSDWMKRQSELSLDPPAVREAALHLPLDGDADGMIEKATRCDGDNEIVCNDAPKFGRTDPFTYSIWVRPALKQNRMLVLHQSVAAEDAGFRGLQLTIDDGHPEFSMIHFWPGNAVRIEGTESIPVDRWTHIAVTHDGSGRAAGLRLFINGQQVEVKVERDKLTRDIRHRNEWGDSSVGKVNLALGARFRDIGFRDGLVDDLKVYKQQLSAAEIAAIHHQANAESPSAITFDQAFEHQLLVADEKLEQLRAELQQSREHENEVVTKIRNIMVMRHFADAPATHVLDRGEYTEKADIVSAGVPEFLSDIPTEGEGRLALAHWMTDPANPLTSRVIANRLWHLFFGRGIVVTLEDFGAQGSPPSHPQLLDYMARTLMDHQWDLQSLCREIVLSATYRQSSTIEDKETYAADPNNVYLARGPKHRLSAEQLRDAVLFASGLLVEKVGGPSVMPYQPRGLWKESGTGKSYHQSTGDGLYRRSLYTFWKRTAPPPSMLTFDATSRETCTARRELTTTPLQALVFLNDPQYVEASRVLAEHLLQTFPEDQKSRWENLFRRLISRPPTAKERNVVNELYQEQLAYFSDSPDMAAQLLKVGDKPANASLEPSNLAATTIVVQTIIAYDETIMLR